ncbi:hypothetical protein GOP47_0015502 [Adiantum capillus-veneris]|uniref:D-aminoacyl-tRNA deacylase n=1 Tax=Adiantum capillus-veneris TaxID=13818 RepID=A0A9D4UJU0_ADICA|nr:hypothetical protein GOP47_0015502 [Adiantum capillus-veneris]
MRALVQLVQSARVEVDSLVAAEIGPGLLVYVGFSNADSLVEANTMCKKLLNLPVFVSEEADRSSKVNVMQKNYELLLVSQFSLYGVFKGNRLDFHDAMPPQQAKPLYEALLECFGQHYNAHRIKDGIFGVKRKVFLVNSGPLAFQLDSKSLDTTEDI